MAISKGGIYSADRHRKTTRQGRGRGTKWGRPGSNGGSNNYKKKYRGQGKWKIKWKFLKQ